MAATDALIKEAKESLNTQDESRLAKALEGIVENETSRWRLLMTLNGIWPEPNPRASDKDVNGLAKHLACLLGAMQILLRASTNHFDTVVTMMRVLQGALALQRYYLDIPKQLKTLEIAKLPPSIQIWRLLSHIEDQHYLTRKAILKIASEKGHLDPYRTRGSLLENPEDGSRKSYGDNLDGLCENIELAIRFILHGKEQPILPARSEVKSPYEDPDYERFLILAGIWRIVGDAWANLKFRQWSWMTRKAGDNICAPEDPADMLREHAAAIRYSIFIEQRILRSVNDNRDPAVAVARARAIESLNDSIVSPTWDGSINLEALKFVCDHSDFKAFCNEYINARHYFPLLGKLRVAGIDWGTWYSGTNVLRVLAEVLGEKLDGSIDANDSDSPTKRVLVISNNLIKQIIVACSPLGDAEAGRFLEAVRFDPKRKHLEIWSQPLIPCSDDSCFFAPSLIHSGNPARSIENFVDEWGGASFDSRGVPFERYLVDELRKRTDGIVEHGIKVPLTDTYSLEFDILFHWRGHLFIIEAKCSKTIFSASDYFRAKCQIDKSIDQLTIRRNALEGIWEEIRIRAPKLALPEDYPGLEKVHCISVTNVMDFTGIHQDGIVVTDDSCLFRFFDESVIRQSTLSNNGETTGPIVGRIRDNDEPTPDELMKYLIKPLPMEFFTQYTKPNCFFVHRISDQTRGFWFAYPEYSPPDDHFGSSPPAPA